MRTFRVLIVATLAAGGLAMLAPAASASAPTKSSIQKFCAAAGKISGNVGNSSGSDSALKLAKTIRNAAKLAPTSALKSALYAMADYYEAIGNAKSDPEKAASALKNSGKITKAATTFSTYYAKNCVTIST